VLELIKSGVEIPPGSILFEDPPTHDVHRSLLSRVFTPRRIAELEPKVRAFCAESLDPMVGAGSFDFIADLGAQMPMRTIGMLLGIPEEDQQALRDEMDEGFRLKEGAPPEQGRAMLTSGDAFADYIDWRMDHPSGDLMTELLNFLTLIAAAGNETVARLMGWAGLTLARNPDQRDILLDDRSAIPGAVEELLRYEAPSPVQARRVMRDVEVHGQTVPEGAVMLLLTGSAGRDDRVYPDPDRFDVRRVPQHVSLGHGVHFCLGAALARLEGRIAIEEFLDRFPKWTVDEDRVEMGHTSTVRGPEKLPITV
jgi:cytochrome P450